MKRLLSPRIPVFSFTSQAMSEANNPREPVWPIMMFSRSSRWRNMHSTVSSLKFLHCMSGYECVLLHITKPLIYYYMCICEHRCVHDCVQTDQKMVVGSLFFQPLLSRQNVSSFRSLCPPSLEVFFSPVSPPSHCRNTGVTDACHHILPSYPFHYGLWVSTEMVLLVG